MKKMEKAEVFDEKKKCWTFKATNHHLQDMKAAEKANKTEDKLRDTEPQQELF